MRQGGSDADSSGDAAGSASSSKLMVIITPSPDNIFFKAEQDAAKAQAEKLGYETTYLADLAADESSGACALKVAIYATPEKVGEAAHRGMEASSVSIRDRARTRGCRCSSSCASP